MSNVNRKPWTSYSRSLYVGLVILYSHANLAQAHGPYSLCYEALAGIKGNLQEKVDLLRLEEIYPAELMRKVFFELPGYDPESSLAIEETLPKGKDLGPGENIPGVSPNLSDSVRAEIAADHGRVRIATSESGGNSFVVTSYGVPVLTFTAHDLNAEAVKHELKHFSDWKELRDLIIRENGKESDPTFIAEAGRRAYILTRAVPGKGKFYIESRATLEEYKSQLQKLTLNEAGEATQLKQAALNILISRHEGASEQEKIIDLLDNAVSQSAYAHATAVWNVSEQEGPITFNIDYLERGIAQDRMQKFGMWAKLNGKEDKVKASITSDELKVKELKKRLGVIRELQDEYLKAFLQDYQRNAKLVISLIRKNIPESEQAFYQPLISKLSLPIPAGPENSILYFPDMDPLMAAWYPGNYYGSAAMKRYLAKHPQVP